MLQYCSLCEAAGWALRGCAGLWSNAVCLSWSGAELLSLQDNSPCTHLGRTRGTHCAWWAACPCPEHGILHWDVLPLLPLLPVPQHISTGPLLSFMPFHLYSCIKVSQWKSGCKFTGSLSSKSFRTPSIGGHLVPGISNRVRGDGLT